MTSSKLNRKIVVHFSDSHGGNILGLRMPFTKISNTNGSEQKDLSECQLRLYNIYETARKKVIEIAGKDEIILIHGGDVCQGDIYEDDRETGTIADDILIAKDNFIPFLELPNVKTLRICKGTSVHNFGNGSAEILVKELLSSKFPKKSIEAINYGLLDINGFTINQAHHGPGTGRRFWLKGNEARLYLISLMMDEISFGNRPCDLYLFGHVHNYVKVIHWLEDRGTEYESMLVVTPSMCMIGAYGIMATRSQFLITNGMTVFEVVNNRILNVYRLFDTIDIRKKEKL